MSSEPRLVHIGGQPPPEVWEYQFRNDLVHMDATRAIHPHALYRVGTGQMTLWCHLDGAHHYPLLTKAAFDISGARWSAVVIETEVRPGTTYVTLLGGHRLISVRYDTPQSRILAIWRQTIRKARRRSAGHGSKRTFGKDYGGE